MLRQACKSWWGLAFALLLILQPLQLLLADENTDRAVRVEAILEKHCFNCHGGKPNEVKGDLEVLHYPSLVENERGIVVPRKADESAILERITHSDNSLRMPPAPNQPLTEADVRTIREWITSGATPFKGRQSLKKVAGKLAVSQLASQVKELFRTNCLGCHNEQKATAGINILDRSALLKRRKIVPGDAEHSRIFQLITTSGKNRMPPEGNRPLEYRDIEIVREWLAAGAPDFPSDVVDANAGPSEGVGIEAVLSRILTHTRAIGAEDRIYFRYFSANHLAAAGATRKELDLQRDAFAKAINHLSMQPDIVTVTPIDPPLNSLFAVDIRKLGWDKRPFKVVSNGQAVTPSALTIYDLALLEYPYAYVPLDSQTYDQIAQEYLVPSGMVRPIPFLRSDWFVSVITQPPLYEDFLQLPLDLEKLERELIGVDVEANLKNRRAIRAGVTVSGVSRNNRIVERHPSTLSKMYWRSIDFSGSKGVQNMFLDPVNPHGAGGEFIFSLPNKLQGYYVANSTGRRLDAAPTEIVTDKFAADKVVRNGLACMRCHDEGMKLFIDTVRPALLKVPGRVAFDKQEALGLYREQHEMDGYLQTDRDRFMRALEEALGKPQEIEPLTPVSHRFLDEDLPLHLAAAELGLADSRGLEGIFRLPQFASLGLTSLGAPGGSVRRDTWEDYVHQVVNDLGLGIPIVPLDGLIRQEFPPLAMITDIELTTNRKGNVFNAGDVAEIIVTNRSPHPVYLELVGVGTRGNMVLLTDHNKQLASGEQYRLPGLKVGSAEGKEQIVVFASKQPFPESSIIRGVNQGDRLVHKFYDLRFENGRLRPTAIPTAIIKRTLTIETR